MLFSWHNLVKSKIHSHCCQATKTGTCQPLLSIQQATLARTGIKASRINAYLVVSIYGNLVFLNIDIAQVSNQPWSPIDKIFHSVFGTHIQNLSSSKVEQVSLAKSCHFVHHGYQCWIPTFHLSN